ncbi:hypothetical protein REPUB_Repub11eG0126400 [Reevesia pubescens]
MASISLDPFVGRLISTLENEASSLTGVSNEINEMKLLLKSIRSFLVDADRAGENSERQKAWVASVRDIASQVEDTIDEFMYHLNRRRQWSFIHRTLHFQKDLLVRHKVAAKLQDINKKMNRITERAHQFGVQQLEERGSCYDPNWKNRLSEASLFFKDDDLVGIKKAQHELLGWLLSEEPRRTAMSVVGMGGSGKTTLVANTFNKQSVKQHFDFCTWITVSQQYAIEELFRSMVKEVYKQTNVEVLMKVDTMSYKELVETLVQYLQSRKYLIVLDDVWSIQFWQEINIVLPEGMCGSRVMVTTRREDVAPSQFGFVSHIHPIQPLGKHEAWELFCKRAFQNDLGGCPSHLDSFARKLVEKGEGLPLAIVALGGLMSSKKSLAEWKTVHDNLNWEISNNPKLETVKTITLLSYHDLSFHLKHCFLYCSIFPEDYQIRRKRLIRLWMAEGFLEQVNDVSPEVVAESYLMELINRSLLQVTMRNFSGRPTELKMHDLLRESALSISKEEKLVAVSDGKKGVEENGIRRYAIEVRNKEINPAGNGTSQLRSLFIFVVDEISKSSFNKLPSGLKLLRVLDLENAPINELPSEFGHLFNLRYLNLTRTQLKVLPKSIGRLFNLQTLVLNRTKIEKLPNEVVKLQNLRHLTALYLVNREINASLEFVRSVRVPPNICMIKSLQVLFDVQATGTLIKQLKEMTQLTRLGLGGLKEAYEKDLCFSVERMEHLKHLKLSSEPRVPLKVDALSSAPPYLEKLGLIGKLEKVPHWFNTLLNLKYLMLQHSELGEDVLSHIQALPNLVYLQLSSGAFQGERLCFIEGFQKLQCLILKYCPQLKEIVMEKGVMPDLEFLELVRCRELRRLPYGWEHLTHLNEVRLYDVSDELVQSICEKGNGDLPTTPFISLTRSTDDEAESKWVHKILN